MTCISEGLVRKAISANIANNNGNYAKNRIESICKSWSGEAGERAYITVGIKRIDLWLDRERWRRCW